MTVARMTQPASQVVYVGPQQFTRHHLVTYANGTTERVPNSTLRSAMARAGVYCTPVWAAPLRGLGVDS